MMRFTLTVLALFTMITPALAQVTAPPPLPQIIAVLDPIPNDDVGTDGRGPFMAWRTRSAIYREQVNASLLWRPVPKEQFRPGELFSTYRIDCFLNKTTGPVRVSLLGTGIAQGRAFFFPPVNPPKRTEAVASSIPTRPDGPAGPFGHCDGFNFTKQLPGPDAIDAYSGKPLWTKEPAWWEVQAWVEMFWTPERPLMPTYFRSAWIKVGL